MLCSLDFLFVVITCDGNSRTCRSYRARCVLALVLSLSGFDVEDGLDDDGAFVVCLRLYNFFSLRR